MRRNCCVRANSTPLTTSPIAATNSIHADETIHRELDCLVTTGGMLPEPAGHARKYSWTVKNAY